MSIDALTGSQLVHEDPAASRFMVHRSSMTDQGVWEEELERIFSHCWLYVGHESEIREPGDYVRRDVGGRPVFMVRGTKTGAVNVFHNTCTHRGALVCRQAKGNGKAFQCFYHGWTFGTEGDLVGMPDQEAYAPDLDRESLGLARVARVDSYRGFVFCCYDPDAVSLTDYLAGAKDYLDLIIDSCGGELEVIKGTNEYGMKANWKLLVENSVDGYHASTVHQTYFKYLASLGTDLSIGVHGSPMDLGNGHAVLRYRAPWGRPVAKWEALFGEEARKDIEARRAELEAVYGKERAEMMCDVNRNMIIFPNLVVNDIMAITIRTFMPTSPSTMEVTAWEAAPPGEQADVRQRRLDSFLTFLGPGGFATPDDIEALESCQKGFTSGGVLWNDISRGMARDSTGTDEDQMRVWWRRWRDQMDGASVASDPVSPAPVGSSPEAGI